MLNNSFFKILFFEIKAVTKNSVDYLTPVLFFIIAVSLFPMAITPLPEQLQAIGPGVIWVSALLASLLSLNSLFRQDQQSGVIDLYLLSPNSLFGLLLSKITAHWLMTGLPLVLIAPILGIFLQLPTSALIALMQSLVLGTPILSLIGAIGVALTIGLANSALLLPLLVLPLFIPVLIFGAASVMAAEQGIAWGGELAILAALLILAVFLAPLAAGSALKIGVEQ